MYSLYWLDTHSLCSPPLLVLLEYYDIALVKTERIDRDGHQCSDTPSFSYWSNTNHVNSLIVIFTETPVTQCILDHIERELGCHPPWTASRLGLEKSSDDKYLKFLEILWVRFVSVDTRLDPCH